MEMLPSPSILQRCQHLTVWLGLLVCLYECYLTQCTTEGFLDMDLLGFLRVPKRTFELGAHITLESRTIHTYGYTTLFVC